MVYYLMFVFWYFCLRVFSIYFRVLVRVWVRVRI